MEFEAAFFGHYVYHAKWTVDLSLRLKCTIAKRDEVVEHDGNATGFYLWGKEGTDAGNVGHFPINRNIKTYQAVFRCKQKLPRDSKRRCKKKKRSWPMMHKEMINVL